MPGLASLPQGAPFGWAGALARIAAFVALTLLLAIVIGWLYALLPLGSFGDAAAILGSGVIAAAAVAAGALLITGVDGRSPVALGFGASRQTAGLSALGLLIGAAALAAAVTVLLAAGMLTYAPQPGSTTGWLRAVLAQGGIFAVAAFAEEVLFRGYAFQVLVAIAGAPVAVAVSSAAFAAAHGANPDVGAFALLNIFLAGVLLGVAYLRTLSLWFATTLHLGWNWSMATLFDLPVSGIQSFDTPLYQPALAGPDWFSGGAFGPEGGAVGTLGFLVALAAVLRLRSVRPDRTVVAARPMAWKQEPELA